MVLCEDMHEMMIKGGFWILRCTFACSVLHLVATKSRYPFTDTLGLLRQQKLLFFLLSTSQVLAAEFWLRMRSCIFCVLLSLHQAAFYIYAEKDLKRDCRKDWVSVCTIYRNQDGQ